MHYIDVNLIESLSYSNSGYLKSSRKLKKIDCLIKLNFFCTLLKGNYNISPEFQIVEKDCFVHIKDKPPCSRCVLKCISLKNQFSEIIYSACISIDTLIMKDGNPIIIDNDLIFCAVYLKEILDTLNVDRIIISCP